MQGGLRNGEYHRSILLAHFTNRCPSWTRNPFPETYPATRLAVVAGTTSQVSLVLSLKPIMTFINYM